MFGCPESPPFSTYVLVPAAIDRARKLEKHLWGEGKGNNFSCIVYSGSIFPTKHAQPARGTQEPPTSALVGKQSLRPGRLLVQTSLSVLPSALQGSSSPSPYPRPSWALAQLHGPSPSRMTPTASTQQPMPSLREIKPKATKSHR